MYIIITIQLIMCICIAASYIATLKKYCLNENKFKFQGKNHHHHIAQLASMLRSYSTTVTTHYIPL